MEFNRSLNGMASSPTIEDRLANIEEAVSRIHVDALAEQVAKLTSMLEEMKDRKPPKEQYSISEAAEIVGRSEYQVREWCREGRLKAEKRGTGRGRHKEWMVSHDELDRYRSRGLNPPAN